MRIVQLSDFHMEPAGTLAYGVADTLAQTRAAIDHVLTLPQKPDAVVVTGDVASSGNAQAYAQVREQLQRLDAAHIPAYVLPGNHDHRGRMREYLGPWCPADASVAPYLCYTVDDGAVRLVMLDTMRPGSHSGHLTAEAALWLRATLEAAPHKPTLLFTHHPPFLSHMGCMDEPYENAAALEEILRGHVQHSLAQHNQAQRNQTQRDQTQRCQAHNHAPNQTQLRLCCGHMHRAYVTLWAECLCLCAPATSMQIPVDLSPEGGDVFVMEAPGYVLHYYDGGSCNSYFCQIPGQPTYSGPHPFAGVVNPHE